MTKFQTAKRGRKRKKSIANIKETGSHGKPVKKSSQGGTGYERIVIREEKFGEMKP